MTKATKQETLSQLMITMDRVSREYGLSDDQEPWIEIKECGSAMGFYRPSENKIQISWRHLDPNTIAHELAHWVQYQQQGESFCFSSTPTSEQTGSVLVLCYEHAALTADIEALMEQDGSSAWFTAQRNLRLEIWTPSEVAHA